MSSTQAGSHIVLLLDAVLVSAFLMGMITVHGLTEEALCVCVCVCVCKREYVCVCVCV